MTKIVDWDSHIGRRLRLRDLHVFLTVVQLGSMAKAAARFRVSQPAVSKVIAGLEHALGVTLLERSRRGVAPTIYARALITRARAAFDDLRQGIRDIEFLNDPTSGEVRIAAPESISAALLPAMIERFNRQYPRVVVHIDEVPSPSQEWAGVRDRTHDLILARIVRPLTDKDHDLNVEILFDDQLVVVVHAQSQWARRRKIDLAELIDEPWIVPPSHSLMHSLVLEAFKARGLRAPKISMVTFSVHLRTILTARGAFITIFPRSTLRLNADFFFLKALPINLSSPPFPVALVTLKNQVLSPVVERFIDCAREVAKSVVSHTQGATACDRKPYVS